MVRDLDCVCSWSHSAVSLKVKVISCHQAQLHINLMVSTQKSFGLPLSQIFATYLVATSAIYMKSFGWPDFSFISALPTVTDMQLIWKSILVFTRLKIRLFKAAQMVTCGITMHMRFALETVGVDKSWLLPSRESPFNWGKDIFSKPENNQKGKKNLQWVGFEMALEERLGLRGGTCGLANNYRGTRTLQGPARSHCLDILYLILYLHPPARGCKLFLLSSGEMESSCLNLF